jgi:hypothetical protein
MAMHVRESLTEKVEGYKLYWKREPVDRPLIGFDISGFDFFSRFKAFQGDNAPKQLSTQSLNPQDFIDDYEQFYQDSIQVPDDFIKGISPIPAVPWAELMLGCSNKLAPGSVWALEMQATWDELSAVRLADDDPWLLKYLEFIESLAALADGRYPVSQPIIRGVSDLHGALRGHYQSLIDLLAEPERCRELFEQLTAFLIDLIKKQFETIPPYAGGYAIEQFGIWAPGPLARIQEDATANYSPKLYEQLLLEPNRRLAAAFPYTLIHLHNSSLFILDLFLQIEEIDCFEINMDTTGMTLEEELPYLQRIQDAGRCLLLRGNYSPEELELVKNHLDPTGLAVQTVLYSIEQVEQYRTVVDKLWP